MSYPSVEIISYPCAACDRTFPSEGLRDSHEPSHVDFLKGAVATAQKASESARHSMESTKRYFEQSWRFCLNKRTQERIAFLEPFVKKHKALQERSLQANNEVKDLEERLGTASREVAVLNSLLAESTQKIIELEEKWTREREGNESSEKANFEGLGKRNIERYLERIERILEEFIYGVVSSYHACAF
jgi:predicted nuclease with TOPRIM domain